MRVAVLGAVGVREALSTVPSGEIAQRVLAVLAAEANRPVDPDRLADLVWPGANRRAGNSLQAHISRWRKAIGPGRIGYSPAGYTLVLGIDELDALSFEEAGRSALAARAAGDAAAALKLCEQALSFWHGAPFGSLADDDCVRGRRVELESLRDRLRLTRLELLCDRGDHARVIQEAVSIAETDRWNEPLHRVLARAHYGSGDQVAALRVLRDLQERLRHDLGLDLGAASDLLREQMLRHEPALDLAMGAGDQALAGDVPVGALADRFAALPVRTRTLLGAAALSGPRLDTAHLGRVLRLDGPTLAVALEPALRAAIVIREDAGVRFASAAVHEAVRELVPTGDALSLHRRLGEDLLARPDGPDYERRAADHLAEAACVDAAAALRAVELDHRLAIAALAQAHHDQAVHHARRALLSAAHVAADAIDRVDRASLWLTQGRALQRAGDLDAAMTSYDTAGRLPGATTETLVACALAHEECSLHGRRHRTGAHDPSIQLLEAALAVAGPDHGARAELLGALAQALAFSGMAERAARLVEEAVEEARDAEPETLARTLLRSVAVQDPLTGARRRGELAGEAARVSRASDAAELELEALCAWAPEIMRAGRLEEVERVIGRVEQLAELTGNVLHRCKPPMWHAALALAAGHHDEAQILIEDFRDAGERDGYVDTGRIHGFQSILLALGRGQPDRAVAILTQFDDDRAFEPWVAARLAVAHAAGDEPTVRELLAPWSARRFRLARPFAGVQTFCACLVAEAVAVWGDEVDRARLAAVIEPGVGWRQVLGAGAAMLGDGARALELLADAPAVRR